MNTILIPQIEKLLIPKKVLAAISNSLDEASGLFDAALTYIDPKGNPKPFSNYKQIIQTSAKQPVAVDNNPTSGFEYVDSKQTYLELDKGRSPHIYLKDPRGFIVRIRMQNFLQIIQIGGISDQHVLSGEFVYAWHKQHLTLLPVASPRYQSASTCSKKIFK